MKVTKIGYGCTSKVGKQTQQIYIEAELEDWEDFDPSLEVLRDKVAYELDLAYELVSLHEKTRDAMNDLSAIRSEIVRAKIYWSQIRKFLVDHGLAPDALSLPPEDSIPF